MTISDRTTRRLLISAFGIHLGGGLVLLKSLMQVAQKFSKEILIDSRFEGDLYDEKNIFITRVPKSFWSRIKAQSLLAIRASDGDVLLSFNSLPPLFRSKAYVINYVHAPHFIGAHAGVHYVTLTRIRMLIERLWFYLGIRHCDEVWVQTETMYLAINRKYPKLSLRVIPLVDDELINGLVSDNYSIKDVDSNQYSFFYPADAVGHKNHSRLLAAWQQLANQGLCPKLLLTLKPDEMDVAFNELGMNKLDFPQIENLGRLSRSEVLKRMQTSTGLIFPSLAETFGIPMLEAQIYGKPIIASERDFVRDVCSPVETFDPESSRSIARAVARYMTNQSMPKLRLYSATTFVQELINCGNVSNN